NYDTPWNATRLMQRIGRVNRIGSVAGVVYNYNFYPSKQGDEEIHLYNNALVKLQGFHTAFGEDAKIFTHEELVEQFELFKEGLPDEEDKRLHYLRFIREFKDSNPKEFKRIKNFPLKARTARKNKYTMNDNAKDSSAVFLRSPYKMEFYQIDKEENVKSLTFLEAAEIFQATVAEPAYDLPKIHYSHVQAALDLFEKDFLGTSTEKVTTTEKADAISAQAKKFLRDMKGLSKKNEVKTICANLADLVDAGTFTPLPNEIRKIRQKLDKKQITYAQADNLLLALAKKYDALELEENETQPPTDLDFNISPEIVISENFIP
ncbi:helicase, partial [candidate division KSB1 bacterium]|nr:helicase [candidate division KSB1 bacterium]